MIDTHAHFRQIPHTDMGINKLSAVVLAASCLEDSYENVELAKTFKGKLFASVGIHPQEVDQDPEKLTELLNDNPEIVALGECGLEFTDGVDKNLQEKNFRAQIELSLQFEKALIVHSRKASNETLAVLKEYQNLRGVIHCYTGGKKRIPSYMELSGNWYFGIDGNLTYEIGLEEVVKEIPKDRLVLETDSPFLTPLPYRGEENKPDYIEFVYQKVAEIWELSFEEAEEIIDENAKRLFRI